MNEERKPGVLLPGLAFLEMTKIQDLYEFIIEQIKLKTRFLTIKCIEDTATSGVLFTFNFSSKVISKFERKRS